VYGPEVQNGYDGVPGPLPASGFSDFPSNDYAALFPSPDGEITLAPWGLNTNTVTFTAWINPNGPQNPYGGLIYVVGPLDGFGVIYTGSTDVNGNQTLGYSWDYDPNTFGWDSGITPPPGQWSLVALVVTSTNATVYILNTNGILSSTHTYNHEVQPFSATPQLGSLYSQPNNGAYNGSMDHVAIFNQALTELQLVDLYGGATGVSGLPPGITGEPLPQQTLFSGQSAQFSVQASGYPAPSYQWQIETNGIYVNLTNGGRISGATSASLTITKLQPGDATNYLAEAFNSAGSAQSAPASLTVLPAPPPGSPRAIVTVINPSFEDNQQSGDTYTTPFGSINPRTGVPGWQFSSSESNSYSGIVTETGTTFGSPKYIPQGWQAAFVQGTGQFSQAVTFNTAGTYMICFRAEGRSNAGAGAQTIILTVDGNAVGTFTPLTTQWARYTSSEFNVNAGVHVVSFAGTVPYAQSDRSSFIDAVQIVTPAEAFAAVPPTSPVYDIIFIGDSITYGATLADPAAQASAVQCMRSLGTRYNVAVRMSNQGHSGATTVDWLPESPYNPAYFQGAVAAAAELESNQPGQLVFSIMLGANDSAQSGPDGAPVSPSNFLVNLQSIINQLLVDYTNAYVFVHYPTWYSTNTQTGALYGAAGLARLQTYFPQIDQLISNCAITESGLVFAGDKLAFGDFESNYLTEMTPTSGPQGIFYLHPNAAGAVVLGECWANAIAAPRDFSTNDSYVTWLQSADLTPGTPGTGFSDTPTNSLGSNGDSYGNPNGLIVTFATNGVAVSADIRNDTNLTVVLQDSDDLISWSPLTWPIASSQSGVATGFSRHAVQVPIDNLQQEKFYRLVLKY
jgi:lysophospholipase L1-like esterase